MCAYLLASCSQAEDGVSPVTEAITAAVREAGGRALGGKAVFVPLLERCRTETTVQIARAPHPTLPSLRAQLSVPRLRFFVSAARVRRLMRVLRSALPGQPSGTRMSHTDKLCGLLCRQGGPWDQNALRTGHVMLCWRNNARMLRNDMPDRAS